MIYRYHEAEFVVDATKNSKRWHFATKIAGVSKDGGPSVTDPDALEEVDEMVLPDGYFKLSKGFLPAHSDKWERTLVILPASQAEQRVGPLSQSFDPFWYLSVQGQKAFEYLDEAHRFWTKYASARTFHIVEQQGDIIQFHVGLESISNRFRFDLSRGGNLVEAETRAGKQTSTTVIDYVKIGDIWLPSDFNLETNLAKPNIFHRHVQFLGNGVNQPMDANEFTIEKMGVLPNTRVSDNRTHLFYLYGQESRARVVSTRATTTPSVLSAPPRSSTWQPKGVRR
jgi:hypothetical protein